MKVTVGNLSYRAVENDLRRLFGAHASVVSIALSRGSATVELRERTRAAEAVRALDGVRFHGRPITVSETLPSGAWLMDVQEEYADFVR